MGRATFEAKEPERAQLAVVTDVPGLDDPAANEFFTKGMERSLTT
jgi:hypothetical protein